MAEKTANIAVAGATGAVGNQMIKCLEEREFPAASIKLLASHRSAGREIRFRGEHLTVEELREDSFKNVDIALFSAGAGTSKDYAPIAARDIQGAGRCSDSVGRGHGSVRHAVRPALPAQRRACHQACHTGQGLTGLVPAVVHRCWHGPRCQQASSVPRPKRTTSRSVRLPWAPRPGQRGPLQSCLGGPGGLRLPRQTGLQALGGLHGAWKARAVLG